MGSGTDRDPEVSELHVPEPVDQDVAGLDVAVDLRAKTAGINIQPHTSNHDQ